MELPDVPATTVCGDPRIWPRGHRINQGDIDRLGLEEATRRYGDRKGTGAYRASVAEALALQGFPPDWPVAGGRELQYRQIGNAVNAAVATAVMNSMIDVEHDVHVLDLFGGAGGFSLGAHALTDSVTSIELDPAACATQRAAGMNVLEYDIRDLSPVRYASVIPEYLGADGVWRRVWFHLHASPPCQSFSAAGKGQGRKHLELLCAAVVELFAASAEGREPEMPDLSELDSENTALVLEPARWIIQLLPDSVSMEQVRAVLPVWEAYLEGLRMIGYDGWAKNLHSEQFGVPQTRVRAWLGAKKQTEDVPPPPEPPKPTHSQFYPRNPSKLDDGVEKWVSMADALGRGLTGRPYPTVAAGTGAGGADHEALGGSGARQAITNEIEAGRWAEPRAIGFPRRADSDDTIEIDGVDYRARDLRPDDLPSFALTSKSRSWINVPLVVESTDAPATRRVTINEAGVLQGFPGNFPWQSSRTSQFRQCANAVNPHVASVVLEGLVAPLV